MNSVDGEARSIDKAVERALEFLQPPRDRVGIEILADASRGILVLGERRTRVRGALSAALPDRKSERDQVSRETDAGESAPPNHQLAITARARASSTPKPPRPPSPPSPRLSAVTLVPSSNARWIRRLSRGVIWIKLSGWPICGALSSDRSSSGRRHIPNWPGDRPDWPAGSG